MKFEEPKQEAASNVFIKLKDGDAVKGIVTGDECIYYKKWVDGKTVDCSPEDEGSSFRFMVNMLVNEEGTYKAKILDQGRKVYEALRDLSTDGYELDRTVIKISRAGSGLNDTRYTILPVPNGVLNDTQLEELSSIELHKLERK